MDMLRENQEKIVTDLTGLAIIFIGLISLTEALLQVKLIGSELPLYQGTFVSMTAILLGAVLLTENATKALKQLRKTCSRKITDAKKGLKT